MAGGRLVELQDFGSSTPAPHTSPPAYSPPEARLARPQSRPRSPSPGAAAAEADGGETLRVHAAEPAQLASAAAARPDAGVIAKQLSRALGAGPGHAQPATELREEVFRDVLGCEEVDVDELRRIVWAHGVPERPWARAVTWKLFSEYLPSCQADWDGVLATRRTEYWALVAELTVDPSDSAAAGDHPLCVSSGSRWAEYFRDRDLREVIDKDVVRTHADLHRFAPLRDALRRILFVFSKDEGAKDGYRQGMNELAAPFLLCFSEAPFVDPGDAEADAFFCFRNIMREMATVYAVKETDQAGVGRQLQEMQALLRIKDPRLADHLTQLGVDPRFYALRWIRLWLAREFTLPDVLRMWDSFLAAGVRLSWVRYVCVAMQIRIRDSLLASDFAGCMKLLLHYPNIDVADILAVADRLRTANVTIIRTVRRR